MRCTPDRLSGLSVSGRRAGDLEFDREMAQGNEMIVPSGYVFARPWFGLVMRPSRCITANVSFFTWLLANGVATIT